ncbi:hypothetical protein [Cognatishimia sp.]|uniref:hypothetical protein n=1 Tax=Cognatishimia sp. TaxID=2211648 RepID=UPI0035134A17
MRTLTHPGPQSDTRLQLAPCGGRPIAVTLQSGIPLETAVAQALATEDIDSAWLTVSGAPFERLDYVIPDHAPDDTHVAWYSQTHTLLNGCITRLGMIVGTHNGASFLHGHGLWNADDGPDALGHVLAPTTVLSEPVFAKGIGLTGAIFERGPDPETNFDLFHVKARAAEGSDYAALRIAPNQDFSTALDDALVTLGWASADAVGLGSLVGAQFESGATLDSHATEFLITDAPIGPDAPPPEIVIVGIDGSQIKSGRLERGQNAVLVTAEVVLRRTG